MSFAHLVTVAAEVPLAGAVLVAAVGVLRAVLTASLAGDVLAGSFSLSLELLLAAGIMRLAARPGAMVLALVALVVLIRQVIGVGLRFGREALAGRRAPAAGPPA